MRHREDEGMGVEQEEYEDPGESEEDEDSEASTRPKHQRRRPFIPLLFAVGMYRLDFLVLAPLVDACRNAGASSC